MLLTTYYTFIRDLRFLDTFGAGVVGPAFFSFNYS